MKNQLNPAIAEEFARKIFSTMIDAENRDFQLMHAKHVGDTSLILSENKQLNKELLRTAAWLHDIGQKIERDNHARHSIEILEKEGFEIDEKLRDCILNHGSHDIPETEEGKIIHVADKVCIMNPEFVHLLVKYKKGKMPEEDIRFITKMTQRAVELLKDFEF